MRDISATINSVLKLYCFVLSFLSPILVSPRRRPHKSTSMASSANPKLRHGGCHWILLFLLLLCSCYCTDAGSSLKFLGEHPFEAFASRSSEKGKILYRLFAIDSQTGDSDGITYALLESNSSSSLFSMNPTTGEIILTSQFPSLQGYLLTVEARASSTGAAESVQITVAVVTELQATRARFEHESYEIQISESTPVNREFSLIGAFSLSTRNSEYVESYSLAGGTSGNIFSIDPSSGILTVMKPLDRERTTDYFLIIEFSYGTRSIYTQVHVVLLDANDNAPRFEGVVYDVSFPENTPVSSTILQISATDPDLGTNGDVLYGLNIFGEGQFSLNSQSGVIVLSRPLDFERVSEYRFSVTAMDQGMPSLTSTVIVTVHVENMADECPIFQNSIFTSYHQAGTTGTLLQVLATDPDELSDIAYSIVSATGEGSSSVAINPETGIVSRENNDLGTTGQYFLNVSARDDNCSMKSFVPVEIRLDSTENFPPQLQGGCEANMTENPLLGTEVIVLMATDDDGGFYGRLTYSLTDSSYFVIDSSTGTVSTVRNPGSYDRESDPVLRVGALVRDGGLLQDYCLLTVYLMDVNDNVPVFATPSYTASVGSNSPANAFVSNVSAYDADSGPNGNISYSFSIPSNLFSMDSTTGVVTTSQSPLAPGSYALIVIASDSGSPVLTSSTTLTINVLAGSTNFPVFEQMYYNATICETVFSSSAILIVEASDSPVYSIIRGTTYDFNSGETLRLQGNTLTRGSNQIVNFELLRSRKSFLFLIKALNIRGSNFATVEVFVEDTDDNAPQLIGAQSFNLAENLPVETVVSQIMATDLDSGLFGQVVYELSVPSIYFNISADGTIRSTYVFDFERPGEMLSGILQVRAYNPNQAVINNQLDSDCPPTSEQSSSFAVFWRILDQNDEPPRFTQSAYSYDVPENSSIGTTVLNFDASDSDEGDGSSLSYSIANGNIGGAFSIEGGMLILRTRLDARRVPVYTLSVDVTDGVNFGSSCLQCSASFTINITEPANPPPSFTRSFYEADLMENAPVWTTVLTVTAADPNSDSIRYSLSANVQDILNVSSTGVITVTGNLDRESYPHGVLSFMAFAEEEGRRGGVEGGGISSAAVNLTLLDVNDCPPRFQQVYTGMVEENLALGPGGILVAQVLAVDLDEGRNGMVTYQLETGMEHGFRIDPVSGNITATAVYDREEQSLYRLRVLAVDEGVPMALSSTTVVTVEIGDVDDNSPFFPFPYMYVRLFETDSAGSHVFQVPAVDLDVGSNAAITYILDSSSLNRFSLNETTGEIVTTGSLDYEIPAHRRSQLNISIRGQESIGQVEVILLDRNDNRPRLDQTIYYDPNLGPDHVIYENIAPGPVWAVVSATDDDEGTNGELVFSLRGGDGDFQINEQGEVNTTQFLDFETRQSYNLTVEIKDGGVPANSLSVELDFIVGDVNDNAPSFESSIYQLTVTENSTSMPNILQVRATDPDSGPGGVVDSYRIASGNTNDTFSLNSTTGVLGVRASLDREAIDSYVLVVSASDQGPTPLTGTAVVRVTVGDVDDNPTMGNGVMDIYLYGLDGMFANRTLAPVYFNDPDISNTFTDCNTLATSSQIFTVSVSSCLFILNGFSPPPGSYIFEAFLGNNIHDNSVIRTNVFYINSADAQDANSVTITINATVEDFFDQRLNSTLFPIIAEKLGVGSSGFNLLSIQSGYHDNDNTLDVTFSARTPQSGVLLSSPEIVSLLYLTRDDLVIGNHGVVSIPTDPCVAEPCSNQARCHATREFGGPELAISTRQAVLYAPKVTLGYQCDCVPGTAGPHCEVNYDDCYSNPCQYGVPCTDAVQGFICDCPPGTFGSDCSFNPDECSASNPCENGATCVNEFNRYICTCQPGYYGNECQYSYFEPSSLCEPSPCLNNGNCSAGRDSFTCQCPSGFDGPLCENPVFLQGGCVGNPCYHGSACTNTDLGPRCTCSVGFSGPFCRWPLSSCELELCQNGATCEDGFYGSYRCTCPPDYTGANCDVRIPACASGPCGNGGRCVDDSDGISFTCQCPPSFAGSRCQVNLLLPTDHCIEAPCSGNCTSGRSGYTCTCSEGFRGDDCTQVAENSTACSSNPCQHGGTCTSQQQGGVAGYMCDCSLGYTGENCEVEIDDCDGIDPCLNRGICVDTIGGHYCDCPPGVTGGACQIHCPAGREGTFCREVVQYCNNSSCLNGGTCDEATGGFRCTCPVAFTGSTCEIPNTCQSSTCRNGGTCISVEGGGSKCNCPEGFDGANCELLSVSFSGGSSTSSYRAFHTLDHQGQGSISLDFATTQQDGLLLYSSQYQDGQSLDFIAAEIVDGFVRVSMSQGSGQRGVVLTSESVRVSDGRWHRVSIERSGKVSWHDDAQYWCLLSFKVNWSIFFFFFFFPIEALSTS